MVDRENPRYAVRPLIPSRPQPHGGAVGGAAVLRELAAVIYVTGSGARALAG
jgi:hypothetical protein